MLPKADQTAEPIGLEIFVDTYGWPEGVIGKKIKFFSSFFSFFSKKNFHGQRQALQLENSTIALLRYYPLCPSNYFPPFPSLAPWFLIIYIDPCISFVTIHLN